MKSAIILFFTFILSLSPALAEQKSSSSSVEQLIKQVKSSTGDSRRVAMNTLKVKLRSMNQATRQQVMRDLQKSFSTQQHGIAQGNRQEGRSGNVRASEGRQANLYHGANHVTTTHTPTPSIRNQTIPTTPQIPHTSPPKPQRVSPHIHAPHFGQQGGRK